MKSVFVGDFESTTEENDCHVWAFLCMDIQGKEIYKATNIKDSIELMYNFEKVYFHNLKFDGSLILDYILRNNYVHTTEKELEHGEFTTLISDMGVFYSIKICLKPKIPYGKKVVELWDSYKVIPLPVEEIPKAYGLEEAKGRIDYHKKRGEGYEPTDKEWEYIYHDVNIVRQALLLQFTQGMVKMTTASNALKWFKTNYSGKFEKDFPQLTLEVDYDIRQTYKGGWTYLNPKYKNKDIGDGRVYDVNSMYPWAMSTQLLPYGEPIRYEGEPKLTSRYKLYTTHFSATFKLKNGHYPSIQLKNSYRFLDTEYIEECDEPVILALTSVDFELFKFNYDYEIDEYYGGYYFKAKYGIFSDYISYWYEQKDSNKHNGNVGLMTIAKLYLNTLYGKFGSRLTARSKIPYLDSNKNIVRYKITDEEKKDGWAGYIPIATFITAYCRDKIIRGAVNCGDRFIYADTDSLHVIGDKDIDCLDIDKYKLGAFDHESTFENAKFIRPKTYAEVVNGKLEIKAAGLPRKVKDSISYQDFYEGAEYDGKLTCQVVPGGIILRETTFKIKSKLKKKA